MQGWPGDKQLFVYETIDSTMAEARRQASTISGAAWFLSYEQTAGVGRRGRAWDTQNGNFAASLLIRPNATPDQLALRGFVAALALYDTLVALTGRKDAFTLKWPNDVLLNGGKLAGILLETFNEGQGNPALIIGIGVNLINMPALEKLEKGFNSPKSLALDLGLTVAPEEFLNVLEPRFVNWNDQLCTYGFAPIRNAWLARAANIGEIITARMAKTILTGTFKTVDDTGALILQAEDSQHVITAADILF